MNTPERPGHLVTTGRGQVHGFGGAVSSPHTLTSLAAMRVLESGGNAVDAAISANAVQGAVAPETCGIGGDLFALVWTPGDAAPTALNASGWAGTNASAESLRTAGLTEIPTDHPASVSIPGAVAGWFALAERHGSMAVGDLLSSALHYSSDGFPASDELVRARAARREQLSDQPSGAELFGEDDSLGARVTRPLHAATLRLIAEQGRQGFYTGSVAADIVAATENTLTLDDLAEYEPDFVVPLNKSINGHTGWTIGPNSQGYLTLAAMRILEIVQDGFDPEDPLSQHHLIESYRVVAQERDDIVTDPRHTPVAEETLLADDRLATLADMITPEAGVFRAPAPKPGGTAYLCVVDPNGMAISLIQSNFHGLGSGIGAGRAGFLLHNRGAGASLVPGHPNELRPGKRPLHTLSPTLWTRDGAPSLVLGARGGHQQPQLLAQVATNHLVHLDEPYEAQARPRWTMREFGRGSSSHLSIEASMDPSVIEELRRRGHGVDVVESATGGWGPVSMISLSPTGLRTAAADPRVDTTTALAS